MSEHLSEADYLRLRGWYRALVELAPAGQSSDDTELFHKLLRIGEDPRAERMRAMLSDMHGAAFDTLEKFLARFPPAPG